MNEAVSVKFQTSLKYSLGPFMISWINSRPSNIDTVTNDKIIKTSQKLPDSGMVS
jgi:hypothetical protein